MVSENHQCESSATSWAEKNDLEQRNVVYVGHVLRRVRYELLRLIMIGTVADGRKAGCRRIVLCFNMRVDSRARLDWSV